MRRVKAENRSPSSSSTGPLGTFEQFGRIDSLEGGLSGLPFVNVSLLADLAQQQLDSGHPGNASALLRAAEHLCFAALAPKNSAQLTANIPRKLKAAVTAEMNRLTNSAQQLWAATANTVNRAVIEALYAAALADARLAFECGAYRPALQLARAAEALARVAEGLPATLPGNRQLIRLLAS
jgi:hypothetical protein